MAGDLAVGDLRPMNSAGLSTSAGSAPECSRLAALASTKQYSGRTKMEVHRVLIFVDGRVVEPTDYFLIWVEGEYTNHCINTNCSMNGKSIAQNAREQVREMDAKIIAHMRRQ